MKILWKANQEIGSGWIFSRIECHFRVLDTVIAKTSCQLQSRPNLHHLVFPKLAWVALPPIRAGIPPIERRVCSSPIFVDFPNMKLPRYREEFLGNLNSTQLWTPSPPIEWMLKKEPSRARARIFQLILIGMSEMRMPAKCSNIGLVRSLFHSPLSFKFYIQALPGN